MWYLQKSPAPTAIFSLWCVLFLAACASIGAVYVALFPNTVFLLAAIGFIAGVFAIIVTNPQLAAKGYAWMVKFQRGFLLPFVRKWLTSVVFYAVLYVHRSAGKQLDVGPPAPGESMWRSRSDGQQPTGKAESSGVIEEPAETAWVVAMSAWIRNYGSSWMAALIPFMALMNALDDKQSKASVSTETYTLY